MGGATLEEFPASPGETPQVEVDLGGLMEAVSGRIKEKPVCHDQTLRKEAMSAEELSKLTFSLDTPANSVTIGALADMNSPAQAPPFECRIVSSASSIASRESAYFSDLDGNNKVIMTPLRIERGQSDAINQKVTSQTISRNGRLSQRWYNDRQSQRIYRMVTGCVPIVEGGKILFVSASRKPEWILPKGGWESDEVMEESAIRESFEEAGVIGVLGPRLCEIDYETRKSKKRRLDQEEAQKRANNLRESYAVSPDRKVEIAIDASSNVAKVDPIEVAAPASNEKCARIPGLYKPYDETCSVSSDTSTGYSHVRMTLFPLYVTEVKAEWPESGRFRKAVEIDEAIRITANRPELQAALIEVKERDLHRPRGDDKELMDGIDR
jgi:8-oxo-dGTP pyrophosphatase MutT (NUDIX family)